MSIGRALSIVEGPERLKTEKEKKVGEIKKKIEKISKMTLKEYIVHRNGKENENEIEIENSDEEETNVSEIEIKLINWKKFAKKIRKLNIQKIFKFSVNYNKINFKQLNYLIEK